MLFYLFFKVFFFTDYIQTQIKKCEKLYPYLNSYVTAVKTQLLQAVRTPVRSKKSLDDLR